MRRFALVFALLSMTGAAYGQLAFSPIAYTGPATSVFDQNGNLMVFSVSYTYPTTANQSTAVRFPPVVKTHVTVITVPAGVATSFTYDGSFQIAGVGGQAVYAFITSYAPTTIPAPPIAAPGGSGGTVSAGGGTVVGGGTVIVPTPIAYSLNRRLVALNFIASTLPTTLPSIDALGYADVKISKSAVDPGLDTIAVIDSAFLPPILTAGTTGSVSQTSHSVRLFTFDGKVFAPNKPTPIPVP
jgi:hypothetical protein